jgi:tRNA1Val (adenine37-N6)-methyltransferase
MSIFKFKQFDVDQSGCAMKINTDGVLLGALTQCDSPSRILDIGTGTGVIAMMLAQRFNNAIIDAVEIDADAATTAGINFAASPFANRLQIFETGFEDFYKQHPSIKYDLIVSNPPFFLNSLVSAGSKKNLARHTDGSFFEKMVSLSAEHLSESGSCHLILPVATADAVKKLITKNNLALQKITFLKSFADSEPHREMLTFGILPQKMTEENFIIYEKQKVYAEAYQQALKDFFNIF